MCERERKEGKEGCGEGSTGVCRKMRGKERRESGQIQKIVK